MEITLTSIFTQILIILLYVLVGYVAGRVHLISPQLRKDLTHLCSNLILPFTILSATRQTVGEAQIMSLLTATLLMFAVFGLTSAVALFWHQRRGSDKAFRAASTSLVSYPNCTFLGLPLCTALFGDMGILYNCGAMIAFHLLFFSLQYSLFTGEKLRFKHLATPAMITTVIMIVMLRFHVHFPITVQTVIGNIGSMITPLSLMIIGVMMSENHILELFRDKRVFLMCLLRNLVIPCIGLLALLLLPLPQDDKLCVLVYLSCPCATLTSLYAIKCDMEPELSAHTVLLSTLFFAITLPLMLTLGQHVLY